LNWFIITFDLIAKDVWLLDHSRNEVYYAYQWWNLRDKLPDGFI
jgi:hypothetical protein